MTLHDALKVALGWVQDAQLEVSGKCEGCGTMLLTKAERHYRLCIYCHYGEGQEPPIEYEGWE